MYINAKWGMRCVVIALLLMACGISMGVVPTPEAKAFNVVQDTTTDLVYGFAEPLQGANERLGLYVRCERSSGQLSAGMFFGAFPTGKPVQAAVRAANGAVERFGPVVTGSPASGFHDPKLTERSHVLRLLAVALTEGALISNGHNSVWNRIPAAENRKAREAIKRCAR